MVSDCPQSPAIRQSARKPPGVLTGPVCPHVFSASAVTDVPGAKGAAPTAERAAADKARASVFIGRRGAKPLPPAPRPPWDPCLAALPRGCVSAFWKLHSARTKLSALGRVSLALFSFLRTEEGHGPLRFLIPVKAQGYGFSFLSNSLVDNRSLKQPLGLWSPSTDLQMWGWRGEIQKEKEKAQCSCR